MKKFNLNNNNIIIIYIIYKSKNLIILIPILLNIKKDYLISLINPL